MTCGLWRRYVKDPLRPCAKIATGPHSAPAIVGFVVIWTTNPTTARAGPAASAVLRDSEARRALRLLVDHLLPLHRGAPRPVVSEADHLVNRGRLPLERRLDAAIGVFANQTATT